MAELWETGFMISFQINYEPSIKGKLTNHPFKAAYSVTMNIFRKKLFSF